MSQGVQPLIVIWADGHYLLCLWLQLKALPGPVCQGQAACYTAPVLFVSDKEKGFVLAVIVKH